MASGHRSIDDLLYEGERVEERVDLDDGRVVVTSHRVLAFTPETDGANFSYVDRPNVVDVAAGADAEPSHLVRGIKYGVGGLATIGAGILIDFDAIVGDVGLGGVGTEQVGIGGVLGMVQRFLGLIRQLDVVLQVLGALALLLSVGFFGIYLLTREPTIAVEVAGDDDLHVPRPDEHDVETVVSRLEAQLDATAIEGDADRPDDPLADPRD